jgi:predicted NBD/HSP70 family sugar kinase
MKIVNEIGNVQLMQKINRLKVLECIRLKGPVARPEISKVTGLSLSSITNIVTYLLDKGLVAETGTVDSRDVGRKATLIRFNPAALTVISVNIEASKIDLALTDLAGEILEMKQINVGRLMKDYEILNAVKKEITQLIASGTSAHGSEVAGIGIGVSGLVQEGGILAISSSMRWKGLSIKEQFENTFHIPVYIQNNSRTKALWALRSYIGEEDRNVIFLDLTMGVGIISFFENKINEAVKGEFGHTTVKKDGPLCFCGNHGCLEIMCSVDAVVNACTDLLDQGRCGILARLLGERGNALDYDSILEAFEKGDDDVKQVLEECGQYLGIGIANLINIFNPQRLIINGDVLLKSDFIYETAVQETSGRAYEQFLHDLKYQKVDIGEKESIQGVSLYVADKLFELSGSII